MSITLNHIIDRYLADRTYHSSWVERIEERDRNLSHLQSSIQNFITGSKKLGTLCDELEFFASSKSWDSSKRKNSREWALAEMRILSKYHGISSEYRLRDILKGLDCTNTGIKIAEFYRFLLQEKDRLSEILQYVPDIDKSVGKKVKGRPMAPLNGALVITFLGSILDDKIYFCDVYTREALTLLHSKHMIQFNGRVSKDQNSKNIAIINEDDYLRIKGVFDRLIVAYPRLSINYAWSEMFTRWIIDNKDWID